MIAYLLKSILCSAVLIFFYLLFLEREKMHRFNRWYLLASLLFSFAIPLFTFHVTATSRVPAPVVFFTQIAEHTSHPVISGKAEGNKVILLPYLLPVIYSMVTTLLLGRFFLVIYRLMKKARHSRKIYYRDATLILLKEKTVAHTFLNKIFISEKEYDNKTLEIEIMTHELTHVHEKHTLDVLFIELLRAVIWFNPFLYLYRRAIQLNHEFLADHAVVSKFTDAVAYQYLLLAKLAEGNGLSLTSRFNYLITKKRLAMMTKKTPKQIAFLKKMALLPLAALLVFSLANRVEAQQKTKPPVIIPQVESNPSGASPELLNEYQSIIENYKKEGKGWFAKLNSKEAYADRTRLETIFKQMSSEQQHKQPIGFIHPGYLPRVIPTENQLKDFSDPSQYGVWINEKKVSNLELASYKSDDFEQVFISKLYGAARSHVTYNYQVDLMTKDYYRKYRKETLANKNNLLIVKWIPSNK